MTKSQFMNALRFCNGRVKRQFDQNQWVNNRVYMNNGACAEFAAVWIRDQKNGEIDDRTRLEEISWMCEQKNKRGESIVEEFLQGNGISINNVHLSFLRNFNLNNVFNFIKSTPAYYLIVFRTDKGHAVAINTKAAYTFYDANFGEYSFNNMIDLESFVQAFLTVEYQNLLNKGFVKRYL